MLSVKVNWSVLRLKMNLPDMMAVRSARSSERLRGGGRGVGLYVPRAQRGRGGMQSRVAGLRQLAGADAEIAGECRFSADGVASAWRGLAKFATPFATPRHPPARPRQAQPRRPHSSRKIASGGRSETRRPTSTP